MQSGSYTFHWVQRKLRFLKTHPAGCLFVCLWVQCLSYLMLVFLSNALRRICCPISCLSSSHKLSPYKHQSTILDCDIMHAIPSTFTVGFLCGFSRFSYNTEICCSTQSDRLSQGEHMDIVTHHSHMIDCKELIVMQVGCHANMKRPWLFDSKTVLWYQFHLRSARTDCLGACMSLCMHTHKHTSRSYRITVSSVGS